MKKFLEKSHLYFLLFYFAVGDFLVYYYTDKYSFGAVYDDNFELNFSMFFCCLIIFNILILAFCKKYSITKTLKFMLVINIYFSLHYYINIPEAFVLQNQSWKGFGQLFALPFNGNNFTDSMYDITFVTSVCFFILTVVNIILLYVKRKPKTIEDNKKL